MINVHAYQVVENEHLYGPGKRLLIFLQGCTIRCKGCTNSHLWGFGEGRDTSIEELLQACAGLEGITLHGGEPQDQSEQLIHLVKQVKAMGKTVVLFTGYLYKELKLRPQRQIWHLADIVISGRYEEEKQSIYLQFRGSTNQRVYTHKGKYKGYRVRDGKTVAILTLDNLGDASLLGFRNQDLDTLLKDIQRKN